jgi:uncharacterized protein YndB with AHSA1/START domain
VITVAMSTVIEADRRRVWHALTRPDEIVRWSHVRTAGLSVPEAHPRPGQAARWRCRLRGVPLAVTEHPLDVTPAERLRSELRLALVKVEQTWALSDEATDTRTRLSLKLALPNAIPLVDGLLDRFGVRELAQSIADDALRSVKAWCERTDGSAGPSC